MSTPNQTLTGVRVVSLAINLPGPLAAARLASLGARVTKVEPPAGDPMTMVAPSWYEELAGGQEVVTIDLKDPAGRAEVEQRLAEADVLITSMRPSALDRLGLADAAQRHGLVLVEIVGHDGERSEEAGHDLTYQATRGLLDPPSMPRVPLVDVLGSERAVSAALAGLIQRGRTGAGVHQRVVLEDAAHDVSASVRHGLTGPGAVLGGALPFYGLYPAADGWIAVAALEPHFAQRLAAQVGTTAEELRERFAGESAAHWEAFGRQHDIPIVVVREPCT